MRKMIALLLVPVLALTGCAAVPADTGTKPLPTQTQDPMEPEKNTVYADLESGDLDRLPGTEFGDAKDMMETLWNFAWEGDGSLEHNASKADFDGNAPNESNIWRLGTSGEAGKAATLNAGWGVQLLTIGKGNTAYMYIKTDVPATTTHLRVWAVSNKSEHWSGAGAFRAVAIYKNLSGTYTAQVLTPLPDSFTGGSAYADEDGTVRFSGSAWNMPGTQEEAFVAFDTSSIKGREDVILLIQGIGIGETLGTESTEAAEGVSNGAVMPENVIVKRVMFMTERFPAEKPTEVSVPKNALEQTLAFKADGDSFLMMNFLPPTKNVYEKAPVMLLICGGGWREQSRASILGMMGTAVRMLRANGYAVVCADYRLVGKTAASAEDQVTDLMDALRYVSHYADVLRIDPHKVVTMGHSAGAHLALMVGLAPHDRFQSGLFEEDFTVFANVPVGAVTFLYKPTWPYGNDWTYAASPGGVYNEEVARKCSPITYVGSHSPATFLIHGGRDNVVNKEYSVMAYEKGIEAGADFKLLLSENGGHALEDRFPDTPAAPDLNGALLLAVEWILSKYPG